MSKKWSFSKSKKWSFVCKQKNLRAWSTFLTYVATDNIYFLNITLNKGILCLGALSEQKMIMVVLIFVSLMHFKGNTL